MMETPANIVPYVEVLGEDLAIKFLLRFGGAPVYLSLNPQENGDLAQCIGVEMTVALARSFGPGQLYRVPVNREWLAQRLRARDWSVLAIARELHVTDVSVRKWLKPKDQRQLTFFDRL